MRQSGFVGCCKIGVILLLLIAFTLCTERQPPEPTRQMDSDPQFLVRVLLLDDIKTCTLKSDSSISVLNPQTQISHARFDQVGTPIGVEISGGKITISGQPFTDNELIILPDEPYIFSLNGQDYRGKLKLLLNPEDQSFDAINIVPLEPYLAGVVGAEMPGYWEHAALKAQAIAARTYCLYIKKRFGSYRNWDVSKSQAHQVYLGVEAESAQIWNIVNSTYGQIMVCRNSEGIEDIFPAYYGSACGGHTENSKNVFGDDSFEALTGVPCPYCKEVAKPGFFFWPEVQFNKDDVTDKLVKNYPNLNELGKIVNIIPAEQSDYEEFSRWTSAKLIGSTGKSDFVRAEDLRLTIDPTGNKLKSTSFKIVDMGDKWAFISGRGYGHTVGMCQCGAQEMARQGKTAREILSYYYPCSKVVRVY